MINHDPYQIIAANIRQYRRMQQLTQAELAQKISKEPEYISRIETLGKNSSINKVNVISDIAKALDIPLPELFVQHPINKPVNNGTHTYKARFENYYMLEDSRGGEVLAKDTNEVITVIDNEKKLVFAITSVDISEDESGLILKHRVNVFTKGTEILALPVATISYVSTVKGIATSLLDDTHFGEVMDSIDAIYADEWLALRERIFGEYALYDEDGESQHDDVVEKLAGIYEEAMDFQLVEENAVYINDIYVREEYRNKGIYTAFMEWLFGYYGQDAWYITTVNPHEIDTEEDIEEEPEDNLEEEQEEDSGEDLKEGELRLFESEEQFAINHHICNKYGFKLIENFENDATADYVRFACRVPQEDIIIAEQSIKEAEESVRRETSWNNISQRTEQNPESIE